jgi:3-phytase
MKQTSFILILLIKFVFLTSIESQSQGKPGGMVRVTADGETQPMTLPGDAADDPAIWMNRENPEKSLIFGTNKKQGIICYNLNGEIVSEYPVGRINNIDLRYGFPVGEGTVDILAGTNRSDSTVVVFGINPGNGSLVYLLDNPIRPGKMEVYGLCMYHDRFSGKYFIFVTGTYGNAEQWELMPTAHGKISGRMVRSIALKSQTEGCVADDESGIVYFAEEDYGIWKMKADPLSNDRPTLIDSTKSSHLKKDIEGLTIYHAAKGKGYLLVSSQGNNSYAVYRREGKNEYLGSFRIAAGNEIDRTTETDGIDVSGASFGTIYPYGIFVAQDGNNKENRKKQNQNFKLVSWDKIAKEFNPPLDIDVSGAK